MSRRSVTSIKAEVTIRLPPGVKADRALLLMREAIQSWRGQLDHQDPLAALDPNAITVRLTKRETTYP